MEPQFYIFGEFYRPENYNLEEKMAGIIAEGKQQVLAFQDYPLVHILQILDKIGRAWKNRDYPYRRRVFEHLTEELQQSKEAADRDLEVVPQILCRDALKKRLSMSIPLSLEAMDRWVRPCSFPGRIRALPRGVAVHICAGNVFLGALDSLVMGMITKNVNIVKLSSQDPLSLLYFAQSLLAEDNEGIVAKSAAILHWERGSNKVEEIVLHQPDTILVWGGEEAIHYYKANAGPYVRVAGFGPKISFGIIGRESFCRENFPELAANCAHDVCCYDQKACASPQNIFIESRDEPLLREFALELGKAIEQEMRKYPPSAMDADELSEIVKYRENIRFKAAQGGAFLRASPDSSGYTIVYESDNALTVSPLHRFIYLKSFAGAEEFKSIVRGFKDYLQSVGLYAPAANWGRWEYLLTSLGVTRIAALGEMLTACDGAPHDGNWPLLELIHWVATESQSALPHDVSYLRQFLLFVRAHSPFYRRYWEKVSWASADFFRQIPLLTKETFYRNSPPESDEILSGKVPWHPIIFSSGGSTGRPKYSYFADNEFDIIAQGLVDQYLLSGLVPSDIAANLFMAGHLWSSFLAVDRALNKIGVTNLPIGGQTDIPEIAGYLVAFKPNVLFGLPSTLAALLQHTISRHIPLSIEKIFYAGESMPDVMAQNYRNCWGVKSIHSAGYASVDAGLIGYQCPSQRGGYHHLYSDLAILEIVSEDGTIIDKPNVEGEIVVTSLYRKLMPFVRYRTGDLGMYVSEPCQCHRTDPVFCLLGRCDDRLHLGGSRIFVRDLEKLLKKYDVLSGTYQFVARAGEELSVYVESREAEKLSQDFKRDFAGEFYRIFTDFAFSVEKKWAKEAEIHFVLPGTIPRVPRTGKVKLIDDQRPRR